MASKKSSGGSQHTLRLDSVYPQIEDRNLKKKKWQTFFEEGWSSKIWKVFFDISENKIGKGIFINTKIITSLYCKKKD